MTRELHVRLGAAAGDYEAEIMAAESSPECVAARTAGPVALTIPAPRSGGLELGNLQERLLAIRPNEASNATRDIGAYLFDFLFGPLNPGGKVNAIFDRWQSCYQ